MIVVPRLSQIQGEKIRKRGKPILSHARRAIRILGKILSTHMKINCQAKGSEGDMKGTREKSRETRVKHSVKVSVRKEEE